VTVIDTTVPMADWEAAVAGFPDANVYQTGAWAAAKGPRAAARRILVRDGGRPVAAAQLLVRRLGPGLAVGSLPCGPLLADGYRHDPAMADRVLVDVEEEARRVGCVALLVQPSRRDPVTEAVLGQRGYRPAPVDVATSATLEVELGRPDDELFVQLSKSRRNNVRRAERRGVEVEEGVDADLDTFLRLHLASARRHGFLPMSADYLRRQWRALHGPGHLRLFVARMGGTVRAAGTLLAFGPYAEFKLTGWDDSDEARTASVNEAINWAMMTWANAAGYRYFDLGGLPRDLAIEARAAGPDTVIRGTGSEFKHGWGGRVQVYPATWERTLRPLGHLTYRLPSAVLGDRGVGGRIVNWVRRT
jgi:lipid II:glycine glycyltransferase (peptidoglycan interpeptide bridge formation enzyme)